MVTLMIALCHCVVTYNYMSVSKTKNIVLVILLITYFILEMGRKQIYKNMKYKTAFFFKQKTTGSTLA